MADENFIAQAYDRGVHVRSHVTGARVYMYTDTPGVYFNAFGKEVDESLAAEAGYDVETLKKLRLKRERMSEAQRMIEQEFDLSQVREVVEERDGVQLVHIGQGRHNVLDPDGGVLNKARPLSKDEAVKLFNQMAPKKAK